jgi:tetratricopeptide (TPR) repeat protein
MRTLTALLLFLALLAWPAIGAGQIVDDARRQQAIQHYRNGQELMFAEQFEKAAEEFRRAIELDSLLTLAHYGLGQSYMAQKRYASAIQAYLGCREAYRTIFTLQQSRTIQMDRHADEEIRELRDTIQALQRGRIKSLAATVDARVAQLESRIRDLERMRGQDTGTFRTPAEVSLALGSAHFRNGDLADAEREWREAVEVNGRLGEAHNNLAVVYMMSGRAGDAERAVRAAEGSGFRVNPQLKADVQRMSSR